MIKSKKPVKKKQVEAYSYHHEPPAEVVAYTEPEAIIAPNDPLIKRIKSRLVRGAGILEL